MDIHWSILKRDLPDPSMFDQFGAHLVPDLVPDAVAHDLAARKAA